MEAHACGRASWALRVQFADHWQRVWMTFGIQYEVTWTSSLTLSTIIIKWQSSLVYWAFFPVTVTTLVTCEWFSIGEVSWLSRFYKSPEGWFWMMLFIQQCLHWLMLVLMVDMSRAQKHSSVINSSALLTKMWLMIIVVVKRHYADYHWASSQELSFIVPSDSKSAGLCPWVAQLK